MAASGSQETTLVLDAGAVIALSRGDQRARAFLRRAIEADVRVVIPTVVVAETVRGRGPRDAGVNRVLGAVDDVAELDEETARAAGGLLGRARSDATIDAIIVATAAALGGARILTGDVKDMRGLARGVANIAVHRI